MQARLFNNDVRAMRYLLRMEDVLRVASRAPLSPSVAHFVDRHVSCAVSCIESCCLTTLSRQEAHAGGLEEPLPSVPGRGCLPFHAEPLS